MDSDLWTLVVLGFFFVGVHYNLDKRAPADIEQAAMLPLADDPIVMTNLERKIGRSLSGCGCPGTCRGQCRSGQTLDM